MALNRIYCATGLGDGDTTTTLGDLDTIDGGDLADKDMAIVCDQTNFYFYVLDADSGAVHASPDVIKPANNASTKRWILQSIKVNDITISDDIILATDDVTVGDTLTVGGNTTLSNGLVYVGASDTTQGFLRLYSGPTGGSLGGKLWMYVNPDYDAVVNHYISEVTEDDFQIGPDTDPDSLQYKGNDGKWYFTGAGGVKINGGILDVSAGTIYAGANDSARGVLNLYGGSNNGGTINLYIEADADDTNDRFIIDTDGGIFYIGHNNDTDIFRILTDDTVSFTTAVDVDAALSATTVDADTDFTVGGLVITDGSITDNGTLYLDAATAVSVIGGDRLNVGVSHSEGGLIVVYGSAVGTGGDIRAYFAADSDTNSDYFRMFGNGEALHMGLSNDTDMLVFTGGATPTLDANCAFDVNAAFSATTVDADSDFTVGGTVISDASIVDDGTLSINAVTGVSMTGNGYLYLGSNDVTPGWLRLYGSDAGGAQGGLIDFYNDAGNDTTDEYWRIYASLGNLQIGRTADQDMLVFLEAGTLQARVAFDVDAALTATTVDADTDFTVGTTVITSGDINDTSLNLSGGPVSVTGGSLYLGLTDNTRGGLYIYASASGGGFLRTYVDTDDDDIIDYYTFQTVNDDLWIGPDTDTDALTYSGGTNTWTFNTTAAVQIAGAGGIDWGGTVITDGQILDSGAFIISNPNGTNFTNSLGVGNDAEVYAGVSDSERGHFLAYGSNAGANGGALTLYMGADHDTNNQYYQIKVNEDDLIMGIVGDPDAFKLVGAGAGVATFAFTVDGTFAGTTIADLGTVTTADINGGSIDGATLGAASACTFTSLTGADVAKITWDNIPASDATMSGDITSETVDANASGIGALLVMSADGNWDEADADSATTCGLLGIAVEAGTGTKLVLRRGWVKDTAWTWTPGAQLFVSTTTGAITATAPSGTGDIVQVVGYAESATTIYFNPSPDYIEIA
jgi:hypothetical protein